MKTLLLKSIEDQFVQLNFRWTVFLQLYDSGETNIELMNKSGSNVFGLFQKLVIDDTMSALCRLTDPAAIGKKTNASIPNLLLLSKEENPDLPSDSIDSMYLELEKHMKNIRTLRNKAMSHSDLDYAIGDEPEIRIKYDEIEASIKAIDILLSNFTGNSSDYFPHIPFGTDGNQLLSVLANSHEKG
jgi:hypothetical protein